MQGFIVPLIAYILACTIIGVAANRRALGFWGGVILAVVITPVLALLILIVTRPHEGSRKLAKTARS
jgi:hypothetical protein